MSSFRSDSEGSSVRAALLLAGPVIAQKQILEDGPVTMETLVDRIQIEEDAVLDVDGVVSKGHKEIAKLYQRPGGAQSPAAKAQYRRGNMMLTNPIASMPPGYPRTSLRRGSSSGGVDRPKSGGRR